MNPIIKFFHELFNPHCSHCLQLRREELDQKEIDREVTIAQNICKACELAQRELAIKDKLINDLLEKLTKSESDNPLVNIGKQQIIQTRKPLPSQIRASLELQSKIRAEELRANITANQNAAKPDSSTQSNETVKVDEVNNKVQELENQVLGNSNA